MRSKNFIFKSFCCQFFVWCTTRDPGRTLFKSSSSNSLQRGLFFTLRMNTLIILRCRFICKCYSMSLERVCSINGIIQRANRVPHSSSQCLFEGKYFFFCRLEDFLVRKIEFFNKIGIFNKIKDISDYKMRVIRQGRLRTSQNQLITPIYDKMNPSMRILE